jgi:phosphoglucosamine mutase
MNKLFGTDGIRAEAGKFPLDFSSIHTLAEALVSLLIENGLPPRVIIGRDTRESGEWLEEALFQGIQGAQGEAVSVGIIPTSAISFLTVKYSFSAGIVISASHNPFHDNGIKLFSPEGTKISEKWENYLEEKILNSKTEVINEKPAIIPDTSLEKKYLDFLKTRFLLKALPQKIKIVLDCSNGSSTHYAPEVFTDLGFDVYPINNSPDGKNINAGCGSLHPEILAKTVLEQGADVGVAYDGDADRALWIDEKGRILDGDHTLFINAEYMKRKGTLKSDFVVATEMSNMGLEKALTKYGLKLFRAPVGDKYVLENMVKLGANLGGEQSGHTIFLDDCPTGDGILTSIKMLQVIADYNTSLSSLADGFEVFPQTLKNVRVSKKEDFSLYPEIINTKKEIESQLGDSGRLNLRYSGTEPKARVMIEGEDQKQIEDYAEQMVQVIKKHLG